MVWYPAAVGVLAGASDPAHAALTAAFVLLVNLLPQPILTFINKQPFTGPRSRLAMLYQ